MQKIKMVRGVTLTFEEGCNKQGRSVNARGRTKFAPTG